MRRLADSWVTEINYGPDCVVALWEGPQLLLAKVKDADRQDWYIFNYWEKIPYPTTNPGQDNYYVKRRYKGSSILISIFTHMTISIPPPLRIVIIFFRSRRRKVFYEQFTSKNAVS